MNKKDNKFKTKFNIGDEVMIRRSNTDLFLKGASELRGVVLESHKLTNLKEIEYGIRWHTFAGKENKNNLIDLAYGMYWMESELELSDAYFRNKICFLRLI